jgi:hypothetical protein
MNEFNEFYRRLKHVRWAVLLTAVMLSMAACATTSTTSGSSVPPQFMFVQIADGIEVDGAAKTLRLVNVGQQTLYFSDRPVRIAGHLKLADYLNEWTAQAGKDNFSEDPPNATLSVYEPGKPDNTLAAIEISHPKLDGSDLIYSYKVIDGTLPAKGGATSLFIDMIGVGGGVGRGFHGVGVGARGPGVL